MHLAACLLLAVSVLLGVPARAEPLVIPEFTPNVVDTGGALDAAGAEQVNAEIQRIREASNVWGAVFIVDTLGDDSIEEVAVRAFEKWKLGQAGVDNGLLLVLAMTDRKSRFEVGYGLEGTITDGAALHALDAYLAPRMREGDTAGAIVDAFAYLSRLVEQDPAAVSELASVSTVMAEEEGAEDWGRGLHAWLAFLVPVWLGVPFYKWWVRMRRRRLFEESPGLALKGADEEVANIDSDGSIGKAPKSNWKQTLGLSLFFTVNPGIFVFILAALEEAVYYGTLVIPALFLLLITWLSSRKYGSPEAYQRFLEKVAKERIDMLGKGYLVESSPGRYSYTPAYHASRSSSSSSSSSSRSSSSGGGRSGGGGASSGW